MAGAVWENAVWHEVQLSAGVVRYRELGAGEPLVFLHGILVSGEHWRKVVPRLADRYRCIVPELPLGAHTRALEPDADLTPTGLARLVADFIDALRLPSVTLVANDTGGAIAQIVVARHPERIGRLVLTSCDAFDNFLPPLLRYTQVLARLPGSMLIMAHALRLPFVRSLPIVLGWAAKRPLDPDIVQGYITPLRRDAGVRRDMAKVLKGIAPRYTLAAARRLALYEPPVLIAWATEDRLFPYRHAERLARLFPDVRLVPVPDSYSFVPEDQPELLASLVREFLESHLCHGVNT
jgi:pimeloyl-ACP methyl ester carboxylesterase